MAGTTPRVRRALVVAAVALALVAGVLLLRAQAPSPDGKAAAGGGAARAETERGAPSPALRAPAVTLAPEVVAPPATAPAAHGAFEGKVVSSRDGSPVAVAQLTFARAEEAASVASGPGGAFRFEPRVAGRWALAAVAAPGFLPFAPAWGASPVSLEAKPGEVVRGVVVRLAPEVRYQGLVVDADDHPVAGAEVRIVASAAPDAAVALRDVFTSGEDGRFTFSAPEEALLEARKEGFAPGRGRVDYTVRVAGKLVLRLRPASEDLLAVAGVVEDASGKPVAGATVTAQARRTRDTAGARTGADGRFRLEGLARGGWMILAERPGYAPGAARASAGDLDVRVRLRGGGRLEGRVRDRATGRPVTSFTVVAESWTTRTVSVADPAGHFAVEDLTPGDAEVRVVAPGYAPSPAARIEVPRADEPAAAVEFELAPAGRVTGVVVERGSRKPLAGAAVEVEGSAAAGGVPVRTETVSCADGRFQLDGASEAPMSLFASAEGHHARIVSVAGVPGGESGGPVEIELTPLAPGEDPRVELAGIGAQLAKRGQALRVLGVIPGGGAADAGIVPGDAVLTIDGADVSAMSLSDAVPLLRGPEGTTVTLQVLKGGEGAAVTVVVPRRLVRG